ncbi:hypothetical protein GCM10007890_61990 [Methylobacterium tardum]|uniref:Uncharacterized protein n=1 Tax=Methylobacterium tardum TaxID=374432 RepID=A0AA37WVB1_9HYPH|nr:hypothetical protein GCM10007890_61990 [Methylobacterium tardum]
MPAAWAMGRLDAWEEAMRTAGIASADVRTSLAAPSPYSAAAPRGPSTRLPAPSLQRRRPSGRARVRRRQPTLFGLIQEFRTDAV